MDDNSIITIEQALPNKLHLVALMGRPIFPGVFTPIMIGNPNDVKVVDEVINGDGLIGLSMLKKDNEDPNIEDLHQVGTVAKIVKRINLPDGGVNIFINTLKRYKIKKTLNAQNPIVAAVEYLEDEDSDSMEVKALTRAMLVEMRQISENNPFFSEEMRLNMVNIDNPGKIADFISSILNIDSEEQQRVLETVNVRKRMELVLVFIKKEQELLKIQNRVQSEINEKIERSQREYFLKEELKAIKNELGIASDSPTSEYQKYKKRLQKFTFEGEIKEAVDQELEKLKVMDPNSAEFMVTRNWLETVASLPWKEDNGEYFELESARKILDEDHYGLKDVKDRIVEYLAVRQLRQDNKGTIICLIGPPGVGKTSVGRSIARALNKEFFRFSVGGMRDEAEIKGHRRTYIGALPGKIIQGLKITKSKSPVFMMDEIDKMGKSYQGDPASALLEVLDPEQNVNFRDHYLDLPFDISDVFFIVTANTLDSIPRPLIDRMEVIKLPGYIDSEKLEIARKYLVPRSLEKNGLKKTQVRYTRDSLLHIANGYAREAGVRNFEKNLDKIHRKLAKSLMDFYQENSEELIDPSQSLKDLNEQWEKNVALSLDLEKTEASKAAQASEKSEELYGQIRELKKDLVKFNRDRAKLLASQKYKIDKPLVEKYLGKPRFSEDTVKRANRPGMSVGLAWTSMGGDTLIIEAIAMPGKGGLTLTGQMGKVMRESAHLAMSYVRKIAVEKYQVPAAWFEKNHIHLHIPEGATPKDGPSAGISMATALLSLVTSRTIPDGLAMTGELSLTGQVLSIGGLKEKSLAAKRNRIVDIIIPKGNMRDLEEIPEIVSKGMTYHPVESFEEILPLILP